MASSINTLEQLGDELEMAVMNEVALQDHDERTFQWQEKVFSQVRTCTLSLSNNH